MHESLDNRTTRRDNAWTNSSLRRSPKYRASHRSRRTRFCIRSLEHGRRLCLLSVLLSSGSLWNFLSRRVFGGRTVRFLARLLSRRFGGFVARAFVSDGWGFGFDGGSMGGLDGRFTLERTLTGWTRTGHNYVRLKQECSSFTRVHRQDRLPSYLPTVSVLFVWFLPSLFSVSTAYQKHCISVKRAMWCLLLILFWDFFSTHQVVKKIMFILFWGVFFKFLWDLGTCYFFKFPLVLSFEFPLILVVFKMFSDTTCYFLKFPFMNYSF